MDCHRANIVRWIQRGVGILSVLRKRRRVDDDDYQARDDRQHTIADTHRASA